MDKNTIKGVEQGRAKYAYECVENAKGLKNGKGQKVPDEKAYKSYVKKIPMMIKTNGLGNTLAFCLSKQKNDSGKKDFAYKVIYDQIHSWLNQPGQRYLLGGKTGDLVDVIIQLNSAQYRACTVEVLALFNWLRRFAEGLIEGEDTE